MQCASSTTSSPHVAARRGQHLVAEAGVVEPLGAHEQHVDLAAADRLVGLLPLLHVGGVDGDRADARALGRGDLVAHQREQRRDDHRRPDCPARRSSSGRDEVDRRLAPPGALHDERPAAVDHQRLDRRPLVVVELRVVVAHERAQVLLGTGAGGGRREQVMTRVYQRPRRAARPLRLFQTGVMATLATTDDTAQLVLEAAAVVFALSELSIRLHSGRHANGPAVDRGSLVGVVLGIAAGVSVAVWCALALPAGGFPSGWVTFDLGIALMAGGIAVRQWAVLTLGRWFTVVVRVTQDQAVIDRGPYRWVRHPSYTGLLLTLIGLGIALGSWLSLLALATLPTVGLVLADPGRGGGTADDDRRALPRVRREPSPAGPPPLVAVMAVTCTRLSRTLDKRLPVKDP